MVRGERRGDERTGLLRRSTRRTGRLRHEVVPPTEVDADEVAAELDLGVLTVRLPRTEGSRPRTIDVA